MPDLTGLPALDVAIGAVNIGQRPDELFRREQAHILVQHRPAHFERGHEVAIDQQRVGQEPVGRCGCLTTGASAKVVGRVVRMRR